MCLYDRMTIVRHDVLGAYGRPQKKLLVLTNERHDIDSMKHKPADFENNIQGSISLMRNICGASMGKRSPDDQSNKEA